LKKKKNPIKKKRLVFTNIKELISVLSLYHSANIYLIFKNALTLRDAEGQTFGLK